MIDLNRVNYATGSKEILHDVSFSINTGDKVGLVGSNGAGKTTLLRLINGDLTPTSGEIIKTNEEIGILPQDMRDWLDHSVYEFIEEVTGVKDAREQFDEQCANLEHDSSERTLLLYADALEKYDKFEVASFDANLEKALKRADISSIDTGKEIGNFLVVSEHALHLQRCLLHATMLSYWMSRLTTSMTEVSLYWKNLLRAQMQLS